MSLIKLENIAKYYKSAETVSVGMKHVSLNFDIGEFVAITGESGAGKSTLLNVLSGLDKYEEGEYFLNGEETSHFTIRDWEKFRGAYIGFVFQDYNIIDSYTVLQNVLLALEVQGYDPKTRKQRALELIDRVGLTSHKSHKASKLSGGQKQRCVIARALAKDCPIIVADEPTGNLDSKSGEQIINLLHEVSKDKLVIIVTHDYNHVEQYVTRKILMHDGEVVEDKKIKSTEILKAKEVPHIRNMNVLMLLKFAFRNLFSTPKKLIFIMLMQIIVVAVFTVVYTNQISQIRETGLDSSYTQIYPSVPETRLVVEKRDGTPFTDAEITSINRNRYVNNVYEYGLNFFNERTIYYGITEYEYTYYRELGDTDTSKTLIQSDVDGNLPVEMNEVVLTNYRYYDFQIGQTIELFAGPNNYFGPFGNDVDVYYGNNSFSYESIGEFEIVGFDNLSRDVIYFSEAFLTQNYYDDAYLDNDPLINPYIDQSAYSRLFQTIYDSMEITVDDVTFSYFSTDVNNTYDVVINSYEDTTETVMEHNDFTFSFMDPTYGMYTTSLTNLSVYRRGPLSFNSYITIDEEIMHSVMNEMMTHFEEFYTLEVPKSVVSVSVDGYHNGTRFIETIDQSVYKVYYPANLADPMRDFLVFLYSVLAIFFLGIFGMFLYSIVHAVTKNVMAARKRDFAIFRSVGTSETTLGRLVVLEQIIMNVVAFVIVVVGIQILRANVSLIRAELSYMELQDYIILLVAFALFGAWLGLRFNKKVFKQTVIESLTSSKGGE